MSNKEFQLMVDIAVDYYLKGKTQNEIAKEYYISRPKVSRILKKARENGIVEIRINYDNGNFNKLQRDIKRLFNVKNVFIVPTLSTYDETLEEVCKKAAEKLNSKIKNNTTIGISWGRSLRTTVKYIKQKNVNNVNIVELFGTLDYHKDFNAITNASSELSDKLGARLYPLPAPIYINDKRARDTIKQTPLVANTLAKIDDVDVIITSLGVVSSNGKSVLWDSYPDSEIKNQVQDNSGVGFILAHFFNINGEFLELNCNNELIGINKEQISQKPIFLLCAGIKKAKALYGALRGKMVDTLVCDEEILKKVLDYNDIYYSIEHDGH